MAGKPIPVDRARRVHDALDAFYGEKEVTYLLDQIAAGSGQQLMLKENAHEYLPVAFASRSDLKFTGDSFDLVKKILSEISTDYDYDSKWAKHDLAKHHRNLMLSGLHYSLAGIRHAWPDWFYDHLVEYIWSERTGRWGRETAYYLLKSRSELPERVHVALDRVKGKYRDVTDFQWKLINAIPSRLR